MSNNTAPDSWESQADTSANNSPQHTAEVTAQFSTLNVNAVEFVPSFSFGKIEKTSPSQTPSSNTSPQHNPVLNGE